MQRRSICLDCTFGHLPSFITDFCCLSVWYAAIESTKYYLSTWLVAMNLCWVKMGKRFTL